MIENINLTPNGGLIPLRTIEKKINEIIDHLNKERGIHYDVTPNGIVPRAYGEDRELKDTNSPASIKEDKECIQTTESWTTKVGAMYLNPLTKRSEWLDFIQSEIDKAREEGRKELQEVLDTIIHKFIMTPSQVNATYGIEVENPVTMFMCSKDWDLIKSKIINP